MPFLSAAILLHTRSFAWGEWKVYPSFMLGWCLLVAA